MSIRPFVRVCAGVLVAVCGVPTGLLIAGDTPAATPAPAPAPAPASTPATSRVVTPPAADEVRKADEAALKAHIETLASPEYEGRYPGTKGSKMAADYVQYHFEQLAKYGVVPAFADVEDPSKKTYRQPFDAPAKNVAEKQVASYTIDGTEVKLEAGKDFNVLGLSGSTDVTAPLVFAGYGITMADDGYTSYPDGGENGPSLEGKIAIVLRFEPMTEEGTSRWAKEGWSFAAGLEPKIGSAVRRGAKGVILVNPPGAKDDRMGKLEDVNSVSSREPYEVPVVMISTEAAEALVKAADPQGRTLLELRQIVDKEGALFEMPKATVTLGAKIGKLRPRTDNVGAVLPGAGDLKDRYIVMGAHYDHLGTGLVGVRFPSDRGQIFHGADDNASGTSGLLINAAKLAEEYAKLPADMPRRSVLFLAFSAEESGLNGSRYYTQHPIVPIAQHDYMINTDMIGRLGEKPLEAGGVGTAEGLSDWLSPYFESSGLKVAAKPGGSGPSDHATFYAANVPVLFLFSGMHPDYHRPTDTPEKINYVDAAKIADLARRIALDAALRPEPFVFTSSGGSGAASSDQPAPGRGRVRFGIAPGDYSGDEKGVLVGEVLPDTPAAKAGIKKNDLIIKWNDNRVTGVEEWMPFFSAGKPGDVVKVTVLRDKQEMVIEVTLEARGGAR
ncbi:MAG TPA: M28 family peptidase [Phycisphaerales bacterium]